MTTEVEIQTERIDDIPLLIQQQQAMGIAAIIDQIIRPNGNRQGLSVGWTVVGWISFILSESDHRMSYVEPWAERHMQTLQALLPGEVVARDFNDDRLGDVLRYLSDDEQWASIEQEVGRHLVSVYALPTERVRMDSTSASLYHETEGATLFQYGHSKDHRPDLAQVKVMMGALDPLGLPLATLVTPGNQADDGLYWPALQQSRPVLPQSGVLYIGDSKMESLALRSRVVGQGDHYLTTLSQKGNKPALLESLLQPVWENKQPLQQVYADDDATKVIVQGYETARSQEALVDGETVRWQERVLVIYSPTLAEQAYRGLMQRLARAQEKLTALTPAPGRGKRQARELLPLQERVDTILAEHRVQGLLRVAYEPHSTQRIIRPYAERPARTEESIRYQLQVTRDEAAIDQSTRALGWRLYVTSAPAAQLTLTEAVLAYRSASVIERNFSRLKGRPLGLRPFFVQREDHLTGLIRLLSLALRVLTLIEFVVRRSLQAADAQLAGLYPGNPKQSTDHPTTERLLAAFKELTLTLVHLASPPGASSQPIRHVTPLTPLQTSILEHLGFSPLLYTNLAIADNPNPP